MSIDLSYPLVSSMGQHDPLDGLITYSELQASARKYSGQSSGPDLDPDLSGEIADMANICSGESLITDDPLGLGGLLTGAFKIAQLVIADNFIKPDLLETVAVSSVIGLDSYARGTSLKLPADYRLAFRELGLSIGLAAAERLKGLIEQYPDVFRKHGSFKSPLAHLERLKQYVPIRETINSFWLKPENRGSANWLAHRNINMVMLATSLAPEVYISL